MITIDLSAIYFFLCKLSATICLISVATLGFLSLLILADVDIENDDRWGRCVYIVAAAGVASVAMLIILLLAFVIYEIWKL